MEGNWEGELMSLTDSLIQSMKSLEQFSCSFLNETRARNMCVVIAADFFYLQKLNLILVHSDGDVSWFDETLQETLCRNCPQLVSVQINTFYGTVTVQSNSVNSNIL